MSSLSLTLFFPINPIIIKCAVLKNWKIFGISYRKIPVTEALHSQREGFRTSTMMASHELTFLFPVGKPHPDISRTPVSFRREAYFRRRPVQPGKVKIPSKQVLTNLVVYAQSLRDIWGLPSFEENKPQKREGSRWTKQLKRRSRDNAANRRQLTLIHWEDVVTIKQKHPAMTKRGGGEGQAEHKKVLRDRKCSALL